MRSKGALSAKDNVANHSPPSARTLRRALFCSSIGALTTFAAVGACRRSSTETPVVALATSPQAEVRFAFVRARWASATPAQRAAMRPELNELHNWLEHQEDGLEPVARAYLAIAWLDAGVPSAAEAIARPLYEGPPGVMHDLGTLVQGVAERRLHHAKKAIEILKTIVGKLIDPFARPLLYEELTEANLDEGAWEDAILYAQAWLNADPGADRRELHMQIARALHRLPVDAAQRTIDAERASKGTAGYSPELILILAARIDEGNDELALGDDGGVAINDGGEYDAQGSAYLDLDATIAPTLPLPIRFDPRAIAVLVPTTEAGYGALATAITRGATVVVSPFSPPPLGPIAKSTGKDAALDVSEVSVAPPSPASHHLAVFDTGGTPSGITKAIDTAERAGAAVLVGGTTQIEANALAILAQARHIPTVLLRAPTNMPALPKNEQPFYVVIGPSVADEEKATIAAAAVFPGDHAIVEAYPELSPNAPPSVDPLRVRCDEKPATASATAFPIATWKARKVSTIVMLGDPWCAHRLVDELSTTSAPAYRPQLVLSPSSLELVYESLPFARTIVSAGLLPADDDAPPMLRALWLSQKSPVGWFSALGHDGAALAMSATPGDLLATSEPNEIQKARATTMARLSAAKADLWSTTASGPVGGVVARSTFVRSVGGGGAWHPAWLAD